MNISKTDYTRIHVLYSKMQQDMQKHEKEESKG